MECRATLNDMLMVAKRRRLIGVLREFRKALQVFHVLLHFAINLQYVSDERTTIITCAIIINSDQFYYCFCGRCLFVCLCYFVSQQPRMYCKKAT